MQSKISPVTIYPDQATEIVVTPAAFLPLPIFNVDFRAPDGTSLRTVPVKFTKAEWDNWGNAETDDAYVLGIVADRLGLVLQG